MATRMFISSAGPGCRLTSHASNTNIATLSFGIKRGIGSKFLLQYK